MVTCSVPQCDAKPYLILSFTSVAKIFIFKLKKNGDILILKNHFNGKNE